MRIRVRDAVTADVRCASQHALRSPACVREVVPGQLPGPHAPASSRYPLGPRGEVGGLSGRATPWGTELATKGPL